MKSYSYIELGLPVSQQGINGRKQLGLVERCQPDYILGAKLFFSIKERAKFPLENLRSAHRSPSVFSKVLAARNTNLVTARARKNKRVARMLTNARKDHSIPLIQFKRCECTCLKQRNQKLGNGYCSTNQ